MTGRVDPIYKGICPICGGDARSSILEEYGICERCLTSNSRSYTLNAYTLYETSSFELGKFSKFFNKITNGLTPWGPQKTWARRLINGENVALIAPTGMGKTTLLLIYSLYMFIEYGKKTLLLAPTRSLAKQIYERLRSYSKQINNKPRILFYDSTVSRKRREETLNNIYNGAFDILVGTNNFFLKYMDKIPRNNIDIVIIDDVDSLLRSSRNIIKLLRLLGYTDELIELYKKRIHLLWKIMVSKSLNNDELTKKLVKELIEIEDKITVEYSSGKYKQVVIASATGRIRGTYGKILKSILKMDLSGITIYGRDITDTYILYSNDNDIISEIVKLVKKLGPGGIILISPRHPYKKEIKELLDKLINELHKNNISIEEANSKSVKKLINGELWMIYGSSSYYGISVRGIDAPKTIKYIIFLGTPLFTVELSTFLSSPKILLRMLMLLRDYRGKHEYRERLNKLRKILFGLNSGELKLLSMYLKEKVKLEDLNDKLARIAVELREEYESVLKDLSELLSEKKVIELGTVTLLNNREKNLALIPDVMTYIQASGRTSRLLLGRMTHGLSIIIEYKELVNLVKSLERKLQFFANKFTFKDINDVDLEHEVKLVWETRETISRGALKYKNVLVVVESPTKARTIARFFGKPVRRSIGSINVYEIPVTMGNEIIHLNIMASKGHIYDLTTDPSIEHYGVKLSSDGIHPVYSTIKRCRICGHQFTHGDRCPRCGSTSFTDSITVVNALRKLAQEADEVYIATDPDIEGEKIAYDIYLSIKGFAENIWRIELHEITVNEFLKALKNKRGINKKLVEAEIYRRVTDRLIGFSLSQHLWVKFSKHWLGAGRVQTPVLGWIIDQYMKYKEKRCTVIKYYLENGLIIKKCIDKEHRELVKQLKKADKVRIVIENFNVKKINPPPPLTTDELLYIAGIHGIPAKTTMKIAQELFESGLITYHRTSYHYISSAGINIASKYLENKGLLEYFKPSHWGDKGAHEAIRPVYPYDREDLEKAIVEGVINPVIPLTWLHYRIYDIIFKRFISSQMKYYKILVANAKVYIDSIDLGVLEIPIEIVESGFNVIDGAKTYNDLKGKSEAVIVVENIKTYKSSLEPLHSEASVVKLMKTEGLGRPSTYATIINSIIRHGYVIRSKKKGYLIPTKTGIEVYSYLSSEFPELVSIDTTRNMESMIDNISKGVMDSYTAIQQVYELIKGYKLPLTYKTILEKASISA